MNPWIGVVGAVLGALMGGGIAWFNARFQFRAQEAKDRKKALLGKIEEIYELLSDLNHSFNLLTLEQIKVLTERKPFQTPDKVTAPLAKIQMLINIYAPEVSIEFQKLLDYKTHYGDLLVRRLGLEAKGKDEIVAFLSDLRVIDEGVSRTCESIQRQLCLLARKYI
jgi:hypothetical protein